MKIRLELYDPAELELYARFVVDLAALRKNERLAMQARHEPYMAKAAAEAQAQYNALTSPPLGYIGQPDITDAQREKTYALNRAVHAIAKANR